MLHGVGWKLWSMNQLCFHFPSQGAPNLLCTGKKWVKSFFSFSLSNSHRKFAKKFFLKLVDPSFAVPSGKNKTKLPKTIICPTYCSWSQVTAFDVWACGFAFAVLLLGNCRTWSRLKIYLVNQIQPALTACYMYKLTKSFSPTQQNHSQRYVHFHVFNKQPIAVVCAILFFCMKSLLH